MTDPTLPAWPCYLNGSFTTLDQAKISVLDRGFIFGDGVYEVVPVYAGQPFCMPEHLARLGRSLAETRIKPPMADAQWKRVVADLIAAGEAALDTGDQLIYIQVTRGVALRDHVMNNTIEPTVFAMVTAMKPPTHEQRTQGVACVTADDFRWQKAHIKSVSLLGAVFARQISADEGALETVMFRDGFLSEAAASNVWVVKDGVVMGTPKDHLVLEGIRYGLIERLCHQAGLRFELRRISRAEVQAADELLLSSATKEVLAITQLDGIPVADGKPGPIYAQLHALYQEAKATGGMPAAVTA
jgi:D-alanine transaminase